MPDIPQSITSTLAANAISAFSKDAPLPILPLIIEDGKVRQNRLLPMDTGPKVTRFIGTDYTTTVNDRVLIVTAPLTVTLLPASDFTYRRIDIKSRADGIVVIDTINELIDGATSIELPTINDSVALISDGLQWFTIGSGVQSTGFIVSETDLSDPAYYYYGGNRSSDDWAINRYDRPGGLNLVTATKSNNPSYTTLVLAWPDRTILTYA